MGFTANYYRQPMVKFTLSLVICTIEIWDKKVKIQNILLIMQNKEIRIKFVLDSEQDSRINLTGKKYKFQLFRVFVCLKLKRILYKQIYIIYSTVKTNNNINIHPDLKILSVHNVF